MPHYFASPSEYRHYVDLLVKTHCIRSENDIWWDVRPHHEYPSLEFRLFDMMPVVEDVVGIVAVVQAVVAWFPPTNFLLMDAQLAESGLIPGDEEDHSAADSPESLLLGHKITEVPELVRAANPETYIRPGAPPTQSFSLDAALGRCRGNGIAPRATEPRASGPC